MTNEVLHDHLGSSLACRKTDIHPLLKWINCRAFDRRGDEQRNHQSEAALKMDQSGFPVDQFSRPPLHRGTALSGIWTHDFHLICN